MPIPDMPGDGRVSTDPCFYKEVLDHVSDGVYFVDLERRIFYWNESAFRLTGYRAEEMLGRCCEEFLGHVDATGKRLCLDCPLVACVRDGSTYEAQVFLRHKQGGRVPVAVRVQPIRAADGSIVGAVEIFSDQTAHHAARREAEELERCGPTTSWGVGGAMNFLRWCGTLMRRFLKRWRSDVVSWSRKRHSEMKTAAAYPRQYQSADRW